MRWYIAENKRKIASENFEGHSDRIEIGGEQVAGGITYGVHRILSGSSPTPWCACNRITRTERINPKQIKARYRLKKEKYSSAWN